MVGDGVHTSERIRMGARGRRGGAWCCGGPGVVETKKGYRDLRGLGMRMMAWNRGGGRRGEVFCAAGRRGLC